MQEAAGTDMPTRILAWTLEMPAGTGLRSPMTSHCMRQIGDTLALRVMRTGWGLRSDGHHIQCIAHFQDMHEHHADDGYGLHEPISETRFVRAGCFPAASIIPPVK